MKAFGHLFAFAKIFDCVQGGNAAETIYNTLVKKEALTEYRRDKNFQYKTFLKEKIKEKVKNVKKTNDNETGDPSDIIIGKLGNLRSLFFSEKDFRKNCEDLKDAGAISNDDLEAILAIFKQGLTYETVSKVTKKLLSCLIGTILKNKTAYNEVLGLLLGEENTSENKGVLFLGKMKGETGTENAGSEGSYLSVELAEKWLSRKALEYLIKKEENEEALSNDGDLLEDEPEEITEKKEELKRFISEVKTRYQSSASDILDGVLDKLTEESTADEIAQSIKKTLVIRFIEKIKGETGTENAGPKGSELLVKSVEKLLSHEALKNLVKKEDKEEALSDDGDLLEDEPEENTDDGDLREDEPEITEKKEELKRFIREDVITRVQPSVSDTLDDVLKSLTPKNTNTTEVAESIKNSLVILPEDEERRISMRLNDMRFFRLAEALRIKPENLESYDNDELQKLVVTENEVIEAERNIYDVLVESGKFEKNKDEDKKDILTKKADKKKDGREIREDKDFEEDVVKNGDIDEIRTYLRAKYEKCGDYMQIVRAVYEVEQYKFKHDDTPNTDSVAYNLLISLDIDSTQVIKNLVCGKTRFEKSMRRRALKRLGKDIEIMERLCFPFECPDVFIEAEQKILAVLKASGVFVENNKNKETKDLVKKNFRDVVEEGRFEGIRNYLDAKYEKCGDYIQVAKKRAGFTSDQDEKCGDYIEVAKAVYEVEQYKFEHDDTSNTDSDAYKLLMSLKIDSSQVIRSLVCSDDKNIDRSVRGSVLEELDKDVKTMEKFKLHFMSNEYIRGKATDRYETICEQLHFSEDDKKNALPLLGAVAPDYFGSTRGEERHHFPAPSKSKEDKFNEKIVFTYKETMWKYIVLALQHLADANETKGNDKNYHRLCALYDFGVFSHYYLDALIQRTEGDKDDHSKLDDRLENQIKGFDFTSALTADDKWNFHGNTKKFSTKLSKVEAMLREIVEENKGDIFRAFKQCNVDNERPTTPEKTALENAFKDLCRIFYALNMLEQDIVPSSTAQPQSWVQSLTSWVSGLFGKKKSEKQFKPFFPSWSLEYTAPQTLEQRITAKVGKRSPRNSSRICALADSVSAIKEIPPEENASVWNYVQKKQWLDEPETQLDDDNADIRSQFKKAVDELRDHLGDIGRDQKCIQDYYLERWVSSLEEKNDGGDEAVKQLGTTDKIYEIPYYKRAVNDVVAPEDVIEDIILRMAMTISQKVEKNPNKTLTVKDVPESKELCSVVLKEERIELSKENIEEIISFLKDESDKGKSAIKELRENKTINDVRLCRPDSHHIIIDLASGSEEKKREAESKLRGHFEKIGRPQADIQDYYLERIVDFLATNEVDTALKKLDKTDKIAEIPYEKSAVNNVVAPRDVIEDIILRMAMTVSQKVKENPDLDLATEDVPESEELCSVVLEEEGIRLTTKNIETIISFLKDKRDGGKSAIKELRNKKRINGVRLRGPDSHFTRVIRDLADAVKSGSEREIRKAITELRGHFEKIGRPQADIQDYYLERIVDFLATNEVDFAIKEMYETDKIAEIPYEKSAVNNVVAPRDVIEDIILRMAMTVGKYPNKVLKVKDVPESEELCSVVSEKQLIVLTNEDVKKIISFLKEQGDKGKSAIKELREEGTVAGVKLREKVTLPAIPPKVVLRNPDGTIKWKAFFDSSLWVDILDSVPADSTKCNDVPKCYKPEQRRGLDRTLEDLKRMLKDEEFHKFFGPFSPPGDSGPGACRLGVRIPVLIRRPGVDDPDVDEPGVGEAVFTEIFGNKRIISRGDHFYKLLRLGLFLEACGEPEAADYCYDTLRSYGGLCRRKAVDREKCEK